MGSTGVINAMARGAMADSLRWFPGRAKDLGFLALCYGGEAGEFQNVVKKVMRGSLDMKDASTRVQLTEELTDGFVYMLNLACLLGIDLEKSYEAVRAQNEKRFGGNKNVN
jgi:NTP pyrophosphatase (non-canonical NTP hydrolase)